MQYCTGDKIIFFFFLTEAIVRLYTEGIVATTLSIVRESLSDVYHLVYVFISPVILRRVLVVVTN